MFKTSLSRSKRLRSGAWLRAVCFFEWFCLQLWEDHKWSLCIRVKFGLPECTSQWNQCRHTLLKILHHVPVVSVRLVFWILKLLCREDDRRRAIWTGWKHQSVPCACQISLAGRRGWRCAWSQDRKNLQGQNSSCYNPWTTVSLPGANSTLFHRSQRLLCLVQDSVSNFQGRASHQRLLPEVSVAKKLVLLHSRLRYHQSAGSTGDIHGVEVYSQPMSLELSDYTESLWLLQHFCTATRALAYQGFTRSLPCTCWPPKHNLSTKKAGRNQQCHAAFGRECKHIFLKSLLK